MALGLKKTGTSLWPNLVFPPRHQSTIYLAATITALRHGAGSGVALTRREHQETRRKGTNVCNHCGRNDHQRKSSALCPFNVPAGKVPDHTGMRMINDDQLPTTVDIVPANTQENVTCASSVASVALQDHANQANQLLAIVGRKIE